MAADSRISDGRAPLIDRGIKLFELPVLCRCPDDSGSFSRLSYAKVLGMVAVGGSLVFHHVYGTLVSLLTNLAGGPEARPAIADVASLAARVATLYVQELGVSRPKTAHQLGIGIGGISDEGLPEAFDLEVDTGADGRVQYTPRMLDLGAGQVHFMGDQTDKADRLRRDVEFRNAPGAPKNLAALKVIRDLIDDPEARSIGGDVQIGCTVGPHFRRRFTARPIQFGSPQARRVINSIDIDELGAVGPCFIGIDGFASP